MIRQITLLIWCGLCYVHAQATDAATVIPFVQVGNLIIIKAIVDDQKGNFIIDTGAAEIYLHKKYFKGRKENSNVQTWDVNGEIQASEVFYAKRLQIQNFTKRRIAAKVIDLSHHEKLRNTPIHGILGYPIFKYSELVFDFKNKQLILYQLDRKGNKLAINSNGKSEPTDSFDLNMSRHIPFLVAHIGDKRLRLGIDSGAEINILQANSVKKHQQYLTFQQPLLVSGFSKKKKQVKTVTLSYIEIDHSVFSQMDFALMDLRLFQNQKSIKLDGLLGSEFLQNCQMSINYRKKKLYLWQTSEQQLAIQNTKSAK